MSNEEQYAKAFVDTFGVDAPRLAGLKYQDVKEWDSIGHMNLMTVIEELFRIEMDVDDITDFSSFEQGKSILRKYRVEI